MATVSITPAGDRSSKTYKITYLNEDDEAMTPTSVSWKLTDVYGNVINDRDKVDIETPGEYNYITIKGLDLINAKTGPIIILLTISIVYDSDRGTGLTLTYEKKITVEKYIAIPIVAA